MIRPPTPYTTGAGSGERKQRSRGRFLKRLNGLINVRTDGNAPYAAQLIQGKTGYSAERVLLRSVEHADLEIDVRGETVEVR